MAHISEFSWVKKISHPKEVFKIGDEVECMILSYDLEQGRISLGIKQVLKIHGIKLMKSILLEHRLKEKSQKLLMQEHLLNLKKESADSSMLMIFHGQRKLRIHFLF